MPMDPKDVKRIAGERAKKLREAKDDGDEYKPEPPKDAAPKPDGGAITVTVCIPK